MWKGELYSFVSSYLADLHQGHKRMKLFCNKGWKYLSPMEDIFLKSWATWHRAYCGTTGISGAPPGGPPGPIPALDSNPSHFSSGCPGHTNDQISSTGNNSALNALPCGIVHHPSTLSQCTPSTITSGILSTIFQSGSAGTKCIIPPAEQHLLSTSFHLCST